MRLRKRGGGGFNPGALHWRNGIRWYFAQREVSLPRIMWSDLSWTTGSRSAAKRAAFFGPLLADHQIAFSADLFVAKVRSPNIQAGNRKYHGGIM